MSFRTGVVVALIWVTSLFAVATLARGQAYQFEPLPEPVVLSGSDIAFRVEGRLGPNPAGQMVIRMNGQWVVPVQRTLTKPVR